MPAGERAFTWDVESGGETCSICATESKHYGFRKGTFPFISGIPQGKKLPVPRQKVFLDKFHLVIKHGPQKSKLRGCASQPGYLCDFGRLA